MTPVGMQVLLELLVCLKTRRHICVEIKKLCFSYCSICVLVNIHNQVIENFLSALFTTSKALITGKVKMI